MTTTPSRFCWTRFGIESGESVESILQRKEMDRQAHDGMFLWGIGNSVGPAIEELIKSEPSPKVVFSPMRSKAKDIDVSPTDIMTWTRATTLDGSEWHMPETVRVVSRAFTASGQMKKAHYALVCRSDRPLQVDSGQDEIHAGTLVNLVSQNKLGHSQVTSVVERLRTPEISGTSYPVGFVAELVFPYFVRLTEPAPVTKPNELARCRQIRNHQCAAVL